MAFLFALFLILGGAVSAQTIQDPPDDFKIHLLGEEDAPLTREGPLKVIGLDDNPTLRGELEDIALEARANIRRTTRIDWEGTALIVWAPDDRDFRRKTGRIPEFTSAVANAAYHTVWINGPIWQRNARDENLRVMTHELGHLLVGNLPGGRPRLPLWAEEGLVMHLAGEWNVTRSMALSRAKLFSSMPSLSELESSFPQDPEGQGLAYGVSYQAILLIAGSYGDPPGEVNRLMRRLADEQMGPAFNEQLWNGARRDNWDAELTKRLGSRATNALVLLSSGSILWFVIIGLVFVAAWKKRRARLERESEELTEAPWRESLTPEDVREVWGEKEEDIGGPGGRGELPWEKWERIQAKNEDR